MKGKTFLILLVAAGVLAALWFFRLGDEKRTDALKMGEKLFADLPVNAVARVTIADADHQVTLVRGETVWQVQERSGYPADFDGLRDMVVKLSRLKIGRTFSGSPESLARLSLQAPATPGNSAAGRQVTLKDPSGKVLADIILGQIREAEDGGSGGQYLKKADDDTVYLVDGSFRFLKTAPAQWLKKEILDIKADEVASVTCFADDLQTPVFALSRPEKGAPGRLTPAPSSGTADPAKIDQVFDALGSLTLDDVRDAGGVSLPADAGRTRLVYRLYDGRQISIFPDVDGQENYTIRVAAAAWSEKAHTAVSPESTAGDGDQPTAEEADADTAVPAEKTVQQLNEDLGPWIFSVKKWQYDSFITQAASLLKEEKKPDEGTS